MKWLSAAALPPQCADVSRFLAGKLENAGQPTRKDVLVGGAGPGRRGRLLARTTPTAPTTHTQTHAHIPLPSPSCPPPIHLCPAILHCPRPAQPTSPTPSAPLPHHCKAFVVIHASPSYTHTHTPRLQAIKWLRPALAAHALAAGYAVAVADADVAWTLKPVWDSLLGYAATADADGVMQEKYCE